MKFTSVFGAARQITLETTKNSRRRTSDMCPDHPTELRASCDMHGVLEGLVEDLKDSEDDPFSF